MSDTSSGASTSVPRPPMMDRVNVFFRFRKYIKMLARRWYLILLCLLVGGGYQGYLAYNSPDVYRAISKIGVAPKLQTGYVRQAQYLEELNYFYDTQIEYLRSSEVLGRVQQKMRMDTNLMTAPIDVRPKAVKGRGFFDLVVESSDLNYARRFARTWTREFMDYKNQIRGSALGKNAASTSEEIIRYEKRLEKARADLLDFQKKNNIGSAKETGDAAQARLDKLESEYQSIITLRQRLEHKTKEDIANSVLSADASGQSATAGVSNASDATTADPLDKFASESRYADFQFQLKAKEAELIRLSSVLKPKHPFMVDLERDIKNLKEKNQYQLDLIEEKRLATIESLKKDEISYRPIIDALRRQVLESRGIQYEYERLKEDEVEMKNILANLRKTLQSFDLTAVEESVFTIIEDGVGSSKPVGPNRLRMLVTGLMLGLVCGVGFVYFLDRLDDRLELAEDIEEALGETVLGQIPQVSVKSAKKNRLVMNRMDKHSMFSEAIRGVRSAVMLGCQGNEKQVLLISSAIPGDGKTTFTINFGVALAVSGHKVLVVDADLRRGNTHSYFGHSRAPGFSDVLQGEKSWRDVMQETDVPNLKVIHSGNLPGLPGELLSGPATQTFIEEAKEHFQFVIFDCPPLTAIDDAFALAGYSDGLIFVIRAGQTPMRFASNALAAVRQRGARILGLVLNGIQPDNPYYYYQYYYHAYYSKTEESEADSKQAEEAGKARKGGRDKDNPKQISQTNRNEKATASASHPKHS